MAMAVAARAPGKVILTGEHAVVHGTAAVAAALGLYTTVCIQRSPSSGAHELLVLDLPELNVHLEWHLHLLKDSFDMPGLLDPDPLVVKSCSELTMAMLESFVEEELSSEAGKGDVAGVTAFLFLYVSILGLQPLTVRVTSDLPVGAGLGSSAAFCVAVSAALLTLAGKLELPHCEVSKIAEHGETSRASDWLDVDEKRLDLVNKWAFEGERIIHGRPSGIDNNVSSFGYVVKFQQGQLTRLHTPMPLRMLLTNTKVGRNTKALVAGVGQRALKHPGAMAAIFKAFDEIAEEFVSILESPAAMEGHDRPREMSTENVPKGTDRFENIIRSKEEARLEELVEMNQGLLQCIGVSHPSIDDICHITAAFKLRSKLTGAGGGGCVLTLLPHHAASAFVELVKAELEGNGFSCLEAVIGGTGVQVSCHT